MRIRKIDAISPSNPVSKQWGAWGDSAEAAARISREKYLITDNV